MAGAHAARPSPSARTPRDSVAPALIAATERLLAAGAPFGKLRVQEICDEAGVARSAFYANFADKADLLLAAARKATVDIVWISEEWLTSEPMLGLDALIEAEEKAIAVFRQNRALDAACVELAASNERLAEFWGQRLAGVIDFLTRRVEEGQKTGDVRSDIVPSTTARMVILGADRLHREHVAADDGAGDQRLASEIASLIRHMLHPDARC